ncbi:hypothetical protein [Microbacterium sp. GXF7504]
MRSPFVYFAGELLSETELMAASLDGHLVRLGEGYVPADTVETAALRAASIAPFLGDDAAATHGSAAWILGGCDDPPVRHSVQRSVARRTRHRLDSRYVYRDPRIDPDDLVTLGGLAVTTPVRTVADLARDVGPGARDLVLGLARIHDDVVAQAIAWFAARGKLPGKRPALAFLADCQEDVTR